MASEDDIRGEAESFIGRMAEKSMKGMGFVMTHLTATFGTSLDKAKASQIVRGLLS